MNVSSLEIECAAHAIQRGELVAFPTETVYGLGANALDADAVNRIFVAKGRPLSDPLIVHVAGEPRTLLDQLTKEDVIAPSAHDLSRAQRLVDAFMPGAITLVLPRGARIPTNVTAGGETVAIRMPSHPIARALIEQAGVPIAAPSANRFGHVSPTTAQHVRDDLGDRVNVILNGGSTDIGVESTVINTLTQPARILRHGGITREQIERVLNEVVSDATVAPKDMMQSPGLLERHYAPRAELRTLPDLVSVCHAFDELSAQHKRVGLLLRNDEASRVGSRAPLFLLGATLNDVAKNLYAGLRALDAAQVDVILIVQPPRTGIGAAIADRLRRGAVR
jgi:L-threonylcarbamoyladenylate synthase